MQIRLRIMQVIVILLTGISAGVYADSWNCSSDDLVREVIIEYPQGGSLPCDVVYKKQTEGVEDQVLWSAENEEGYCEDKARELVATLESSGWVCLETVKQEADAGSEAGAESDTASEPAPAADDAGEVDAQ